MFIEYKVYCKMLDWKFFIFRDEFFFCQMMGKKKFVGKKVKIEVVYRFIGKCLLEDYIIEQINNYFIVEFFNIFLWYKYRKIYNEVFNEKEVVVENYNY